MFGEGCSDLEFRNLELWSGLPSEDILANPNLFLRRFARITRPAWQERDPEHVEYDRLLKRGPRQDAPSPHQFSHQKPQGNPPA